MLAINRRVWRFSTYRASCLVNAQGKRGISIQQLDAKRNGRERVVVLGSGWAGYTLARDLDSKRYQTVIVSPRSYFVFTPLLASTSVGTLEYRTAVEPVRSRRSRSEYFQGWADGVDLEQKTLAIEEAVEDPVQSQALTQDRHEVTKAKGRIFTMDWDKLIISVGCYSQTFGTKGVKENAYFLKDVADARKIRHRLLSCFETAALPTTSEETKKQLLSLCCVGAGPTGIEFSAELHDLINEEMTRIYPDLVKYVKITIYDVAPTVLGMFDKKLAQYAMETIKRQGTVIRTSHHVVELRRGSPGQSDEVTVDRSDGAQCYTLTTKEEGQIGVGMVVWSTGLMMNPFISKALAGKVKRNEKSGGIMTTDRMQVKSSDNTVVQNVFALGDCATLEGTSYPATAQVASQQAHWLAKRLNKDDLPSRAFTYKDLGVMAYIGNWNAILQSSGGDVSGRMAWFIWRGAYLAKAVSARNKILIPVFW
nr:putative nadh dehydrogenase [Quercus suber]